MPALRKTVAVVVAGTVEVLVAVCVFETVMVVTGSVTNGTVWYTVSVTVDRGAVLVFFVHAGAVSMQ